MLCACLSRSCHSTPLSASHLVADVSQMCYLCVQYFTWVCTATHEHKADTFNVARNFLEHKLCVCIAMHSHSRPQEPKHEAR
jgi:hypothetical protein